MKKVFAVISMVAFFAAVSAPAFATNEEKPKAKKETTAKVEKSGCASAKVEKSGCASACGAEKVAACDKGKK